MTPRGAVFLSSSCQIGGLRTANPLERKVGIRMDVVMSSEPQENRVNHRKALVLPPGPVPVNTGPILDNDEPLLYADVVLVGSPACDWLTLTTGSKVEAALMHSYTVGVDMSRGLQLKPRKRMQYDGWQGDGFFWGKGSQEGQEHWMIQASGARAQEVLRHALQMHESEGLVKCTRIDIQVTSEEGFAGDLPAVGAALREEPAASWAGRGPRPKVTWYSSDNNRDTLYIGGRTSPRFWRLYNKPVDGELYLRVELEAKGWLSLAIWDRLSDTGLVNIKSVLADEFGALPKVVREVAYEVLPEAMGEGRIPRVVESKDAFLRTEGWLMGTVYPALERFLCHPDAARVRAAFREILGFDV